MTEKEIIELHIENLENTIESCHDLLNLEQDERTTYCIKKLIYDTDRTIKELIKRID